MASSVDPDKVSAIEWNIFTYSNKDQPICPICKNNIEEKQIVVSHLVQTSDKIQKYLHFFHAKCFDILYFRNNLLDKPIQCCYCKTNYSPSNDFISHAYNKFVLLPKIKKIKEIKIEESKILHLFLYYNLQKKIKNQNEILKKKIQELNNFSKNNIIEKEKLKKIKKDIAKYKKLNKKSDEITALKDPYDSFFKFKNLESETLEELKDCHPDQLDLKMNSVIERFINKTFFNYQKNTNNYHDAIHPSSYMILNDQIDLFKKIKNAINQIIHKNEQIKD